MSLELRWYRKNINPSCNVMRHCVVLVFLEPCLMLLESIILHSERRAANQVMGNWFSSLAAWWYVWRRNTSQTNSYQKKSSPHEVLRLILATASLDFRVGLKRALFIFPRVLAFKIRRLVCMRQIYWVCLPNRDKSFFYPMCIQLFSSRFCSTLRTCAAVVREL